MSNEHRCDVTDVELEFHRHQRGIANLDAVPDVFNETYVVFAAFRSKSTNDFAKDRR